MGSLGGHTSLARLRQTSNSCYGGKDQAKLLEVARQAEKDALYFILEFIPEEQELQLIPVFPKATCLLAPALAVARRYTDEAL